MSESMNMNEKSSTNIRNGWFSETEMMWPGQKFSLALDGYSEQKSILYNRQSKYQQILVFESAEYGRVLVLDGVIQFTERDEFSFHEMLVHIPLFCHENPEHVLIVGGGDGGVLREVLKHCDDDEGDGSSNDNRRSKKKLVKKVTVCEIDPEVIDMAKTYFARGPMNCKKSFEHPCVNIVHEDGAEFLSSCGEKFDVILIDFAEPFGPAESLFQPSFYDSMKESLNDNGIVSAQGECFWTQLDYITDVIACCTDIFGSVDYCSTMVPTYPTGQMGFLLAVKEPNFNFRKPLRKPSPRFQEQLQWYNTALHSASFILPQFVQKELSPLITSTGYEGDGEENENEDCFLKGCTVS